MAKKTNKVEKVEVEEIKKPTVSNRPWEVSFTGGTVIESGLTEARAKQKVADLEAKDKELKGKTWKPNFYTITEC